VTLRPRRLLQLGALALLVALAVGFALALAHRPSGARVDLSGRAVSVRQALTPRDPQFGDTVVATIDVFADPSRVDVGSVQVKAGFEPYSVTSSSRSVRTIGGISVIHLERRLRCLDLPCVPVARVKAFRFGPVRVSYRTDARTHTVSSPSPTLRVHSRVTEADLARPVLRVPGPVAAPDRYRLPQTATGYALLALAALLAAGGAALLLRVALRRISPVRRRLPPLERVLRELAAASLNGDSGRRRRALEELARELEPLDLPLSVESRILAWGPGEPQPEAISDLTSRIRTAVRP
jgi:hypothetical protein